MLSLRPTRASWLPWALLMPAVVSAFALGARLGRSPAQPSARASPPQREGPGAWTAPLLACAESADPEDTPLETSFQEIIARAKRDGRAAGVSVYFQRLRSERGVSVGADETYDVASLLKLPMLMAWMRRADADPSVLQAQLVLPAIHADDAQTVRFAPPLTAGTPYTIDALLRASIVDSDNDAFATLLHQISDAEVLEPLTALRVPARRQPDGRVFISPRGVGELFEVLYNATWLSRSGSEKALELLSQSHFDDGLVAGVPAGTRVAHKFGERTLISGATHRVQERELHDCGVVYFAERPFVLCAMTRGQDSAALASVIKELSRATWEHMSHRFGAVAQAP